MTEPVVSYKSLNKNDYKEIQVYKILANDPIYSDYPSVDTDVKENNLTVRVFEYSPKILKYLRKLDEISEKDLLTSFNPESNKQSIEASKGKGGSFFLSTYNNLFIIKTITRNELDTVTNFILFKYTRHMKRYKASLLCPIYGLYSIEFSKGSHSYFIVMRNVIGPYSDLITRQFDLKGSTINRKEKISKDDNLSKITLKDLNFNELEKYFDLNEECTTRLLNQIEEDSYMLCECDVIDYSLYVVILDLNKNNNMGSLLQAFSSKLFKIRSHRTEHEDQLEKIDIQTNEPKKQEFLGKLINTGMQNNLVSSTVIGQNDSAKFYKKYIYISNCKTKAYIISIIDYFQYYNLLKSFETSYKFYLRSRPKSIYEISCIPPDLYYERFVNYLTFLTYDFENDNEKDKQMKDYSEAQLREIN